jgi:hypothetical protein
MVTILVQQGDGRPQLRSPQHLLQVPQCLALGLQLLQPLQPPAT